MSAVWLASTYQYWIFVRVSVKANTAEVVWRLNGVLNQNSIVFSSVSLIVAGVWNIKVEVFECSSMLRCKSSHVTPSNFAGVKVPPLLKTIDAETNVGALTKPKLPLLLPWSYRIVDTREATPKKRGILTSGVLFVFVIGIWIYWSKRVKLLAIPTIPVKRLRLFWGNCICMLYD